MSQILHILRKDVRHLWPYIATVWTLLTLHALVDVGGLSYPRTSAANSAVLLLDTLLPLSIFLLLALVIFQEPLPGDRQFWVTRPYSRFKLLAAKVLFTALFVNVPLLLSDCYYLGPQGFPVLSVFPELLLRQLYLTIAWILPSIVIASITPSVTSFVVTWFGLVLALFLQLFLWSSVMTNSGLDLFPNAGIAIASVIGCAIVILQYARRSRAVSPIVGVALVFAVYPICAGLAAVRDGWVKRKDASEIRVAYDSSRHDDRRLVYIGEVPDGYAVVRFPLKVEGLPSKALLRGTGAVTASLQKERSYMSSVELDGAGYWQKLILGRSDLNVLTQQPISLHTAFHLEADLDEPHIDARLSQGVFFVRSVVCRTTYLDQLGKAAGEPDFFVCHAGLNSTMETEIRIYSKDSLLAQQLNIDPRPVPWGLSPIDDGPGNGTKIAPGDDRVSFIVRRKLAAFDLQMSLQDVPVSDYVVQ